MPLVHRNLSFTSGVEISTGTYDGKEHLIVPVIGLVGDIVVYPSNGLGAEFVPISVLEDFPKGWNGRPVTLNHPPIDSETANTPELLDQIQFGRLFDSRVENGSIKFNAWIDKDKAEEIGPKAIDIVTRCESLQPVEVSTGVFVSIIKSPGVAPNGDKYDYVWMSIVPDHLAMLEKGMIGACSNTDGCGAPRLNEVKKEEVSNMTEESKPKGKEGKESISSPPSPNSQSPPEPEKRGLLSTLLSFFRSNVITDGDSLTDWEIKQILWKTLYVLEPGLSEVVDVQQQESFVVYGIYTGPNYFYYRRSFTLDMANRTATVGDDKVRVSLRSIWVPFAEASNNNDTPTLLEKSELNESKPAVVSDTSSTVSVTRVNCSCGNEKGKETVTMAEEKKDDGNKEIVTLPVPVNQPAQATPSTPNEPKQLSKDEWLSQAPPEMRTIFLRAEREERARRDSYINLLSTKQTHLSKEVLASRSTDQLEELIGILGIDLSSNQVTSLNFSGRGLMEPETDQPERKSRLQGRNYGYSLTAKDEREAAN